ncbi:transposase [Paenibacillus mendelii]|uniref:Transposase n=1 Tax=Paenibacillus mendelii TaxID=206163 RepID=A0ABV6JBZ3_9BACL
MTNLSAAEFLPDEIKSIYNMRWGIETSFRALKYTVGLTSFHAKRRESITQEIFARMIMYNFAERMTSHVVISQMDKRHTYQVNFTVAVHVCRHFLRSRGNVPPPDVEALIRKNILPIRPIHPGQKNTRKIRSKSSVSFVYRVA